MKGFSKPLSQLIFVNEKSEQLQSVLNAKTLRNITNIIRENIAHCLSAAATGDFC